MRDHPYYADCVDRSGKNLATGDQVALKNNSNVWTIVWITRVGFIGFEDSKPTPRFVLTLKCGDATIVINSTLVDLFEDRPYAQVPYMTEVLEMCEEVVTTREKFGKFNSAHEGFAVLHEEFDELKEHVWTKQEDRDLAAMRKEAIQLASAAISFAADVCTEERGRV